MSLLREIQDDAVASDSDIASLLRKCKLLGARLGNAEFSLWVDRELNGYPDRDSLPEYRRLLVQSFGHFSGPFGSGMKNAPIPLSFLGAEFCEHMRYAYLAQPISAYSVLLHGGSTPQENWPPELVAIVGAHIYDGMNCIAAWKVIPSNALAALVDTLKTRVLSFCLEIEAQAPDAGEAPLNSPPLPQERVSQVFTTYITGNVQNLATGSQDFQQTAAVDHNDAVFRDLLHAIASASPGQVGILELAATVEAMRAASGTSGFAKHYQAFVAVLADHIQVFGPVVAPYLPLLAGMLGR
jgi:AbiTii